MAKMGKMIQLTHRLVGLLQVLEWSWKIAAEYLEINGFFSGSFSENFVLDIRQIYKRRHDEDSGDKRTFVATMVAVERAINISEALLEQYKVLMRVSDDSRRSASSAINSPKSDDVEHVVLNRKLEKSKMRFDGHIRGILLFKSIIFTPTTLYKACSAFKHHSENVNSVLQELLKIGLLIDFKDGIISSTKKAVVYVKWLPDVDDAIECQRFEQMLAMFNDDQICADSVIGATVIISLLPHKATPRPVVLNYLNSRRYVRLKLNLISTTGELDENSCGL
jgi:hypothetical protein